MKKIILLLNDDCVFYPGALDKFFHQYSHDLEKMYVFPAFTNHEQKKLFEKTSTKILGPYFIMKYVFRLFIASLMTQGPFPLRLKRFFSLKHLAQYHIDRNENNFS